MPGEYTRLSKPTLRTNAQYLSGFPIQPLIPETQTQQPPAKRMKPSATVTSGDLELQENGKLYN